jgi:hypothetical protein
MNLMNLVIEVYLSLTAILVGSSLLLHLLPRLGKSGKQLSDSLCHAPGIDLLLAYFMLLPLLVGCLIAGGRGAIAALMAQFITLWIWIIFHELVNYIRPNMVFILRLDDGCVVVRDGNAAQC